MKNQNKRTQIMLQTVEAIVEKDGTVRLLEPMHPAQSMRAVVTLLEPVDTQTPLHTFAGLLKNSSAFSDDPVKIQRELRDEYAFSAVSLNTEDYHFDREEANER